MIPGVSNTMQHHNYNQYFQISDAGSANFAADVTPQTLSPANTIFVKLAVSHCQKMKWEGCFASNDTH